MSLFYFYIDKITK